MSSACIHVTVQLKRVTVTTIKYVLYLAVMHESGMSGGLGRLILIPVLISRHLIAVELVRLPYPVRISPDCARLYNIGIGAVMNCKNYLLGNKFFAYYIPGACKLALMITEANASTREAHRKVFDYPSLHQ